MAKEILDQLWEKFELTNDPRLLAEAVMDADFGRQTQLQKAIADYILEHRRTAAYDRHVRNDSFCIMHQANSFLHKFKNKHNSPSHSFSLSSGNVAQATAS